MQHRHHAKKPHHDKKGFTLIEILVVMGIIVALAGIVIVAINPAKQFAQARNTERQSNVNAILNAAGQRIADDDGVFAGTFTVGGATYVCPALPSTATVIASQGGVDLACLTPTYISAQIPVDPDGGTWTSAQNYASGYTIAEDALGRITVCAPNAASETSVPGAASICMTR
jgi:prepilin-type N-terminal cleavage/methylation domain-containing protein